MEYVKKLDSFAKSGFENVFTETSILSGFVKFLLVLYIGRMSPKVPAFVEELFASPYFRFFVFVLIFMFAKIDLTVAVLISVAFLLTMHAIGRAYNYEALENTVETATTATPGVIVAQSAELAKEEVKADLETPVFVTQVVASPDTVVIKPTVDSNGVMTVPSVVVTPVNVINSSGQVAVVEPNVSQVSVEAPVQAPVQAPASAASVPAPTPAPAPAPEADDDLPSCYPTRRFDASKVRPATSEERL